MSKVEYFYLLTVEKPVANGKASYTVAGTVHAGPGTRAGLYVWVRDQLPDDFRSANVVFFSVEPNEMPPAADQESAS